MATDGSDPAPCDPEVFANGEVIYVTHSISSNRMERWVKKVAEQSGQRVDWHFFGGRAVAKAIGNIQMVTAAIEAFRPEHDQLQQESLRKIT
jgi:hypothetical protein